MDGMWDDEMGGGGSGRGGEAVAHCLPSITALQVNMRKTEVKWAGHPAGTLALQKGA